MTITISQDRLRTNITKNLQKRRRFAQDAEARRQVKEQRRLANQRKRREREAREKAAEEKEEAVYMAKLAARRAVADAEMSRMDEVRKRVFLRCHFILKPIIILPRQARDKHRESTQKRCVSAATIGAHDQQSKPGVTKA